MINQNYNIDVRISENELQKALRKEQKKKMKAAKKAAKDREKASRYEADQKSNVRKGEARQILDKAGYTDVRLKNIAPSCQGPGCGGGQVVSVARSGPGPRPVPIAGPVVRSSPAGARPSMAVKPAPRYGYYRDGNRQVPVPITQQGTVRQDYLRAVQRGRTPQSVRNDMARDAKIVLPAKITPQQAGLWIRNPGSRDIVGIDCRRSTVPTVQVNMNVVPAPKALPPYLAYRPALPVRKDRVVTMTDAEGRRYLVEVNADGTVQRDYMRAINDMRSPAARDADSRTTSAHVIPPRPTPYQALPWITNPGRYDVPGIDAVPDAQVTYRKAPSEESANRRRAVASRKSAKSKPRGGNGQFKAAQKKAGPPKRPVPAKSKPVASAKPKSQASAKPKGSTSSKPKQQAKPQSKKTVVASPPKGSTAKASIKKAPVKTTQRTLPVANRKPSPRTDAKAPAARKSASKPASTKKSTGCRR